MRSSQYQDNHFGFTGLFFTVLYILLRTLPHFSFSFLSFSLSLKSPPAHLAEECGRSHPADFRINFSPITLSVQFAVFILPLF